MRSGEETCSQHPLRASVSRAFCEGLWPISNTRPTWTSCKAKAVEQNTGTDKERSVGAVTEPEAGTSRKQRSHGINRSNTQRSPPRRSERATKNRMLWFCTSARDEGCNQSESSANWNQVVDTWRRCRQNKIGKLRSRSVSDSAAETV